MLVDFLRRFATEITFTAVAAALGLLGIFPGVADFLGMGAETLAQFFQALIALLGLFGINTATRKLAAFKASVGPEKAAEIEAAYKAS